MKILKFGGSSISSPAKIKSVIEIVRPYLKDQAAIVFSAFGGVTDELIATSQLAVEGDVSYREMLNEIQKRHLHAVHELIAIQRQARILAQVKMRINELEDVLHGIFLVKERTARTLDYVMSFGELLSAFIIAEAMRDAGMPVRFLDARDVIRTDATFGYAKVNFEKTNKSIEDHFRQDVDTQIITGFIATADTGETTTLGRSGSDYTAAIFAGALNATQLEIWTDVDGMMTADPRMVRKAFTVPELSYEEAMELSHFGAKVIFPATMQPAMTNRIPIWIKNTFNPGFRGTCIHANCSNGKVVKGISSMSNLSLLNLQGSGLVGVIGVSMRLFRSLAEEKINVILISQASSEHSICIAIESSLAHRARIAIEKEFQHEIRSAEIDPVQVEGDHAIVAVVGDGMKHLAGTSGRMFGALGKNGVNVSAIAQGSSERNISAVIRQSDVGKALNSLHEAFFLSDRKVLNVFLVGTGLIGKSLLNMVRTQYASLAKDNFLEVNVVAIANSRWMLFSESGLTTSKAIESMESQGEKMNVNEYVERMIALNLPNSIFVDCTASDDVARFYAHILDSNISIVTPNKKANSGSLNQYRTLKATAARRNVRFLYETNVGAGLPVINTMNDLLLSGDKVISIEAVLSGTLNFIFSSFGNGKKFSDVVSEAKARGYTEPDPRDDLSGMDVARKILILAREAGHPIDIGDINVESLVTEELAGLSVTEFLKDLKHLDEKFDRLKQEAEAKNSKLRYTAALKEGVVTVGLRAVCDAHPFHSLSGTDNMILLTTERYHERPMVIRGPGAGAEVTAAGVFADIIRIGHYAK